ncbi:MAG: hypothetical protein D6812_05250 [Deltaproteobacteria bacterium]|nr:MAG: hypothetical protein D6812_05250 [Deltaproteobacteria bacterium]
MLLHRRLLISVSPRSSEGDPSGAWQQASHLATTSGGAVHLSFDVAESIVHPVPIDRSIDRPRSG